MPDFSFMDDYESTDMLALGSATPQMQKAGADAIVRKDYGTLASLGGYASIGVMDLVDTVATSIPGLSRATGYERGQLNDAMLAKIDMPGLTRFYQENKGGVQVTSAIYGVIAAELATRKIAAAARPFMAAAKTTKWARGMATLDDQYALAMAGVRAADADIARRGLTSAKDIVAMATVPVAKWTGKGLETQMMTLSRATLATSARRLGALKGLRSGVATEITMAATLNQNEFLYSDDWGQNALWMGLGVLAPAGFEHFATNYAMKKFVNSDEIARIRAGALDPTGLEQDLLTPVTQRNVKNPNQYLGKLQGARTDVITALATQADAAIPSGVDPSAFNQMQIAKLGQAFMEAEKVTQKGIGVGGTAFIVGKGDATSIEGRTLKHALKRDSGSLYGVEMVGKKAEGHTFESLHIEKEKLVKEKQEALRAELDVPDLDPSDRARILTELKALKFNEGLTPSLLVDGERLPMSQAGVYDNWEAPVIKEGRLADTPLWEASTTEGKNLGLGIDMDLNIHITKGRTLDQLDYVDMMKLHRVAGKATKSIAQRMMQNPKLKLQLPVNPNWMQLDMAEEVAKLTDGQADIYWGKGLNRESAQVESFAQKVDSVAALPDNLSEKELARLRTRYNLPRMTAYQMGVLGTERGGADMILRGAVKAGGGDSVRGMSLADLKNGFAEAQKIQDLSSMSGTNYRSLTGNSFDFLLDEAGEELQPLMVYSRSLRPHDWSRGDLADRIAIAKMQQANVLMGAGADDFTRSMSQMIYQSPDLRLAAEVSGLSDVQLTPSLPGMGNVAPQSQLGANLNSFVTQEWRARDNPRLLAVTRLRETTDRMSRAWMKDSFEAALGDSLAKLNGPRSLQTRTLLDQFHSPGVSSGWDLSKDTVTHAAGDGSTLYGFVLEDTARNRKRFETQFGRPMEKGQELLGPNGKAVVLDELGLDIQQRFNGLSDMKRKASNSLLRSMSMPEIRHTSWYTPPPNLEGKFVAFTQDVNGRIVPGGTFIANTQRQLDEMIEREARNPDSVTNIQGNIVRGRKEIEDFGTLWDRQQMDLIDANLTVIQGGKKNVGSTAGPEMVTGSFQSSLNAMRDQYLRHGSDLIETILDEQIKAAKQRSHLAAGETKSRASFFKDVQYRSVFDYWLQEVRGRSPLASQASPVAATYNSIEANFNRVMQETAPAASRVFHAATDWITKRNPWGKEVADKEAFEKLSTHLSKFMPFEDAADMIRNRGAGAAPIELADVTGGANKFSSTWVLRMFEAAHPIMNLSGIINAMPAVARHYMPRASESAADFAQRVGHSATIFNTPAGKTLGVVDMGKLAKRGFERAWSRSSDAAFERLSKKGYLSQEVAEFQRQFNAAEADAGAIRKFFSKGVDWVSILSDKSEDFSRSWAHFIGEELGSQLGITSVEALDNFAHDIANKMIANYSPHNRPEIFQGAVGAPIGLYQSFMYNYWQRLFRYVETKDMRSLATQYAMQGGLFGAKTFPGFEQANALFFSQADGETSPYDGLINKFGQSAGDWLMAGSMSNLPKLFGAEGVDLYSRGDVSPRLPGLNLPPAATLFTKIKEGIGRTIDLFSEQNPGISMQQIGELLSNTIPNRPLAGWAEVLMADSKDTDGYGQLVAESQGYMESAYRMMGLRSLRQSKELEAFYGNKEAQEIEASKKERLREASRAMIRSGNPDAIDKIWEAYQLNGGDARNFRRWWIDNFEAATETRTSRQLESVANDPQRASQLQRLLDAEISTQEDEATPDPYDALTPPDPMDDPLTPVATEDDLGISYGDDWSMNQNSEVQ